MQNWQVTILGRPPQLVPIVAPIPAAGQAIVKVAACGLNFADLLMIDGRYQERRTLPFTMGLECAGIVAALGPDTPGPAIGTRVLAFAPGAFTESLCVATNLLVPIPDRMSFEQAAAFPVAYGTSHLALDHRARLQAGESLLVTGASGGVGLTAVELGARMGARVIAIARGPDKLAVAKAAGAHHLIDSETPDLKAELRALGCCDVVYDTVGGALFDPALRCLAPEGRYLTIGFASGDVPQIPANLLLVKNLTVIGLYWGGYLTFRPKVLTDSLSTLLDGFADGQLTPHISHILPFDALPQGLDLLRARAASGKIVLTLSRADPA